MRSTLELKCKFGNSKYCLCPHMNVCPLNTNECRALVFFVQPMSSRWSESQHFKSLHCADFQQLLLFHFQSNKFSFFPRMSYQPSRRFIFHQWPPMTVWNCVWPAFRSPSFLAEHAAENLLRSAFRQTFRLKRWISFKISWNPSKWVPFASPKAFCQVHFFVTSTNNKGLSTWENYFVNLWQSSSLCAVVGGSWAETEFSLFNLRASQWTTVVFARKPGYLVWRCRYSPWKNKHVL